MAIYFERLVQHRSMDSIDGTDPFYNILDAIDSSTALGIKKEDDLFFDPSDFKVNKQMRLPKEARRILCKRPELRTKAEINYAVIALRGVKSIAEYPIRMQQKLAQYGMLESFGARRFVIKETHPAQAFYFVVFGTVLVAVLDDDQTRANVACSLRRGDTFGELAIFSKTKRQSTVITKDDVELLSVSIQTYEKIFMVGGSRNINDPDHNQFIRSIPFLQGWPVKFLGSDPRTFVFTYFKRGAVMVRDSNYSDWIYVVKSGSVTVLKKLNKYKPKVNPRTGFPKPAKKSTKILSPRHNSIRSQISSHTEYKIQFLQSGVIPVRTEKTLRPHTTAGKAPSMDLDERNRLAKSAKSKLTKSCTALSTDTDLRHSIESDTRKDPAHHLLDESVPGSTQQRRTFLDDLDSAYSAKKPSICKADLNPQFVHVQTLTKGDVFGLAQLLFVGQPGMCLISNGVECIMLRKSFFVAHCPAAMLRRFSVEIPPYPKDGEMQENLKIRMIWDAYKRSVSKEVLSSTTRQTRGRVPRGVNKR